MASIRDEEPTINFPEWTDYRKKNGLDPLGMQNTSVSLYQTFLPGISNVTLRMRYYGLYAWLARVYAQQIGDTDPESWKRFVRRAEALYALIAYHHGNETGVAGIEWAEEVYEAASDDVIEFASAAEPGSETYYLKQSWGAFGAAYRSQLFEIGIYTPSSDHAIPLLSVEIGERVADAFEAMLGDAGPAILKAIERGMVSKPELEKLVLTSPSEIAPDSDERSLYQDLLFGGGDASPAAASRRLSLLLIMKIAALLSREPKPDEVRWILYSGFDQEGTPLELGSAALLAQRERWWVYQANDLCHVAFEALLKFTLDVLGEHRGGIALQRLTGICAERILAVADHQVESWGSFQDQIDPSDNAYSPEKENSEWSLTRAIMRNVGRDGVRICSPETAWSAIRLLAIVFKRVRDGARETAAELGHFNPDWFRSLLTESRFLERHTQLPMAEFIDRMIEERVIRRHLWVALRKFRHQGDYTFLIETDEGRVRLREKDGPVFTNPRLGPAITFLRDIHLVGGQGLSDLGAEAVATA